MKVGDLIFIRARVMALTPNAIVVTVDGPRGTVPQVNLDPAAPMFPANRPPPEPEPPTQGV